MTTKLNILFPIGMGFLLVSYLKLAWNSLVQRKFGCFGLAMEVKKVWRSEKGTQIKKKSDGKVRSCRFVVRTRVTY